MIVSGLPDHTLLDPLPRMPNGQTVEHKPDNDLAPHACLRLSLQHSDDDFSPGMAFSIIPESFRYLA
jgi:hypothetical protein